MHKVFKYQLNFLQDVDNLMLPEEADVLRVGFDGAGKMCLWALVDPDADTEKRTFIIRGTGHDLDVENQQVVYLGSIEDTRHPGAWFIWHIFEVMKY